MHREYAAILTEATKHEILSDIYYRVPDSYLAHFFSYICSTKHISVFLTYGYSDTFLVNTMAQFSNTVTGIYQLELHTQ